MRFELGNNRIGSVSVGMELADVRLALGEEGQFIPRGDEKSYGFFGNILQASVGDDGRVQFIEVFSPSEIVFEGKNIVGMKLSKFIDLLPLHADIFTMGGTDGYISYSPNIVVGALSGRIRSAGVFKDSYFDSLPLDRYERL